MSARVSISQITTVSASFADDLDAYRAAGTDGIGIWEFKLAEDSLERFRQSELVAATAVPAVPSILPLPLMEGPEDPEERVAAICAGIRRLAPFEPPCVLFLTGPGEDRTAILEGLRAIADEGQRSGVRVALEPIQREFAHLWTTVSSLDAAAALIAESGADVGLMYDTCTSGASQSNRSSAIATASTASTSPTGGNRRGTRTTASSPETAWSSSARFWRRCAGTGSSTSRSSPRRSCPDRSGVKTPTRSQPKASKSCGRSWRARPQQP